MEDWATPVKTAPSSVPFSEGFFTQSFRLLSSLSNLSAEIESNDNWQPRYVAVGLGVDAAKGGMFLYVLGASPPPSHEIANNPTSLAAI